MNPIDSSSALAALATGPLGTDGAARLRGKSPEDAAREFEVLLLTQVIGAMRRTVGSSGLLSASPERRILDGVFDEAVARSVAERADLGLARQIAPHLAGRSTSRADGSATAVAGAQVPRRADESPMNARPTAPPAPPVRGRREP
jgi:Rod binding domain-containing protein